MHVRWGKKRDQRTDGRTNGQGVSKSRIPIKVRNFGKYLPYRTHDWKNMKQQRTYIMSWGGIYICLDYCELDIKLLWAPLYHFPIRVRNFYKYIPYRAKDWKIWSSKEHISCHEEKIIFAWIESTQCVLQCRTTVSYYNTHHIPSSSVLIFKDPPGISLTRSLHDEEIFLE